MDLQADKILEPKTATPDQGIAASPSDQDETQKPRALIKSEAEGVQLNLGELWEFRELLYFLTLRDVKVRYKHTLMGVAWVLLQPLLTMFIFTLVFGRFVKVDTGTIPYPLFALSGLLLWVFFANGVTNSSQSLLNNSDLITKVYFPRMFVPAASIMAGIVDLSVAFILLICMAFYYGVSSSWNNLLLPFFLVLIALLALSVGLLFSALTVKYRDLRHTLPFVIQIWLFASPVIYPVTLVPPNWRLLVLLNPVAGIVEGFRSSLIGLPFNWPHIAMATGMTLLMLMISAYIFRRAEDSFADVI
jgi:homopolymeric O-antigen transport system permease protein